MPEKLDPQLDELRRRARRRLIGAIVLALAAAVLVPMLLESDPKPLGEDVSVRIPPVDDGKFVTKLGERAKSESKASSAQPETKAASAESRAAPAPPPKVAPPIAIAPSAPSKDSASKESSVKDAAPSQATTTPPLAESDRVAATPPKPSPAEPLATASKDASTTKPADAAGAAKGGTFSVQLAAFSDDKGANALAGRLKKTGHSAYTEPYTTSRGTLWRVRVGPYATRDAAEAARAKLKADGQNGIIATN